MLDPIKINVVKNCLQHFFETQIPPKSLKVSVYEEHWQLRINIEDNAKLLASITMVFHWPVVFLSGFKLEKPLLTISVIDFLYTTIEKAANIFDHPILMATATAHSPIRPTLIDNDWTWLTGIKVPDGPEHVNMYYKNLEEEAKKPIDD
jgi:hypothetical protein